MPLDQACILINFNYFFLSELIIETHKMFWFSRVRKACVHTAVCQLFPMRTEAQTKCCTQHFSFFWVLHHFCATAPRYYSRWKPLLFRKTLLSPSVSTFQTTSRKGRNCRRDNVVRGGEVLLVFSVVLLWHIRWKLTWGEKKQQLRVIRSNVICENLFHNRIQAAHKHPA